ASCELRLADIIHHDWAEVGALLVGGDPYFNTQRSLVIAPAATLRVPAIYEWREFAETCGLMSYGTSLPEAYHHASECVVGVLKGASPAVLARVADVIWLRLGGRYYGPTKRLGNVRFWHKADVTAVLIHVRFWG